MCRSPTFSARTSASAGRNGGRRTSRSRGRGSWSPPSGPDRDSGSRTRASGVSVRVRLGVVVLTGGTLEGCATIDHGTTQRVHFESTPPGASVRAVSHRETAFWQHLLCFPFSLGPLLGGVGEETVTTPGDLTL